LFARIAQAGANDYVKKPFSRDEARALLTTAPHTCEHSAMRTNISINKAYGADSSS
jgi:DNA-binding response OmpR family regulator